MTSVLNVDTIADKAGTGPVGLTKQSAAKHWCMITNGGVPALSNSFNASSVSDDATGNFTISLSSAMQNTNQAALGMVSNSASNPSTSTCTGQLETTSTLAVETIDSSGASADVGFNQFAIQGDLA